jgi:hypothetical protein
MDFLSSAMKKLLVFFLLLLNAFFAHADVSVTGHIYITIQNDPPAITMISFSGSEFYEDSTIGCTAAISDETPEIVVQKYRWLVNDEIVFTGQDTLLPEYFTANDIVTCSITPHDAIQDGKEQNISIMIKPIPLGTRISKSVLQLAGVSSSASELESIRKEKGLTGVTGFVVSGVSSQTHGLVIPLFILALAVLTLIAVNLFLRSNLRKNKSY